MQTIWKYPLPITDRFDLPLPAGALPLSVQVQGGVPCLWAQVNPNAHTVIKRFGIFGTGHTLPEVVGSYVGTFQIHGGALVFHLYEMPMNGN